MMDLFRWDSWTVYRNEHSQYGGNSILAFKVNINILQKSKIEIMEAGLHAIQWKIL